MSNRTLIAMVATAVVVDGERVLVPAGQPLPPLSAHDERELVDARCAFDPAEAGAAQEKDLEAQFAAMRVFMEARERTLQAQASIAAPAGDSAAENSMEHMHAGQRILPQPGTDSAPENAVQLQADAAPATAQRRSTPKEK